MPVDDPTTQAASLAEQILELVTKSDQDWMSVSRLARALSELADRIAIGES